MIDEYMHTTNKRGVGNPRRGRTTKVVRIPIEHDVTELVRFYEDVRPILLAKIQQEPSTSARAYFLNRFLSEISAHI
jgi:hypothetical protein